ncbi:carbamoyltransferase N-terminal domain-containing protein [Actinosynnema sp. NPDC059335]|uniref:carbamoyltransferase N-terminal domain-containing protein n=1 Tax=Actinosynnema sp. NPDC059335 TaxID=3346804 RepID=UPI00366DEA5B
MLICGIKASHDGGVAVIADDRLLFSTEMEKLGNGPRYSALDDLDRVTAVLAAEGISPSDVDRFVVDGWWTAGADGATAVLTRRAGAPFDLPVAPYLDGPRGLLRPHEFDAHDFGGRTPGYVSYHHVANHVLGAYCSSPFAERGEDSLVLVWDGGMVPRLYHVGGRARTVTAIAPVLPVTGNSFADFSARFEPFRRDTDDLSPDEAVRHHLSIAGKAMAYAALGRVEEAAFAVFDEILTGLPGIGQENARVLAEKVAVNRDHLVPGLTDADLIATFQAYLGDRLLAGLTALMRRRFPGQRPHLALAGGCALNIKWNSALRASGLFDGIWVPPFPNDAGAAIGTASCEMFRAGGHTALRWGVYSGPRLVAGDVPDGWRVRPCDERELAALLHREGEPVVVLSGRAEIGPRALGNRSILAPATDPGTKDRLNAIKDRAAYRPVAPICLTSRSEEVFTPGGADPYMLFEHHVRPEWVERIPAVLHLDGSARLQTIDPSADSATGRILAAYAELSGIPVLCNTSANLNGRGFFPDVASAARWGGTRHIWSEGLLYTNPRSSAHSDDHDRFGPSHR